MLYSKRYEFRENMKKKKDPFSRIDDSIIFKIFSLIVARKSENRTVEKMLSLIFNYLFNILDKRFFIHDYVQLAEKISDKRLIVFGASYCRILRLRKIDKIDHFSGKNSLIAFKEAGLMEILTKEEEPIADDIIFIDKSKNIMADYNVYFGVMMLFTNWSEDVKYVEYKLIHPPLNDPESGIINSSIETIAIAPGTTQKGFYYYFMEEWEMIEGKWIFLFTDSYGDSVQQEFNVMRCK
jgi:hypothetical protein